MPARSYTLKDPYGPGSIVTPIFRTGQMLKDDRTGQVVGKIVSLGKAFITVEKGGAFLSFNPATVSPVADLPLLPDA